MSFVIPSTPEDRKSINSAFKEIGDQLTIISAAQDIIKDIGAHLKEEFDMPVRTCNKLSRTMYRQDFKDQALAFEEFESEFEILVKGIK